MKATGVHIRSTTPGLVFSYQNPINTLDSIVIEMGRICHSKFFPFVVYGLDYIGYHKYDLHHYNHNMNDYSSSPKF